MSTFLRLILCENCTVPNGTVLRLVNDDVMKADNVTSGQSEEDAAGAMQFIVATVLVYSILGVFCTLLSKIKRSRGKSYTNAMIDEGVTKYLKKENSLKFDGQKSKLRDTCARVSKRIKDLEDKRVWFDKEREISSEVTQPSSPDVSHKKKRRKKRKKRELSAEEYIGNMELSFYPKSRDPEIPEEATFSGRVGDAQCSLVTISENDVCDSLESLEETNVTASFLPPKAVNADI